MKRIVATATVLSFASLGLVGVGSVWADGDVITTQDYVDTYSLGNLKDMGLSGKGIKIAVYDGTLDTNAPELANANITTKQICPYTPLPQAMTHATAMVSELVATGYGIVPDAQILHYASPTTDEGEQLTDPNCAPQINKALEMALEDGADILSLSVGHEPPEPELLMRANQHGLIIVAGLGNDNKADDPTSWASANLTVGVTATQEDHTRADYSNYGYGATIATMGWLNLRDYKTGQIGQAQGTSISTPIVAGFLALAMEKWPNATHNQILQSLVATAIRTDDEDWDTGLGYGTPNLGKMLTEDPSKYPDENPLLHKKADWAPTEQFYNDYINGLLDSVSIYNDPDYVYRGTDTIAATAEGRRSAYGTSPAYHKPKKK